MARHQLPVALSPDQEAEAKRLMPRYLGPGPNPLTEGQTRLVQAFGRLERQRRRVAASLPASWAGHKSGPGKRPSSATSAPPPARPPGPDTSPGAGGGAVYDARKMRPDEFKARLAGLGLDVSFHEDRRQVPAQTPPAFADIEQRRAALEADRAVRLDAGRIDGRSAEPSALTKRLDDLLGQRDGTDPGLRQELRTVGRDLKPRSGFTPSTAAQAEDLRKAKRARELKALVETKKTEPEARPDGRTMSRRQFQAWLAERGFSLGVGGEGL